MRLNKRGVKKKQKKSEQSLICFHMITRFSKAIEFTLGGIYTLFSFKLMMNPPKRKNQKLEMKQSCHAISEITSCF